jgi:hypothetical protein
LEIDFLKGCLQRIEEARMLQVLNGNPRSSGRSKKKCHYCPANEGIAVGKCFFTESWTGIWVAAI